MTKENEEDPRLNDRESSQTAFDRRTEGENDFKKLRPTKTAKRSK
jgi:hypothetical protein